MTNPDFPPAAVGLLAALVCAGCAPVLPGAEPRAGTPPLAPPRAGVAPRPEAVPRPQGPLQRICAPADAELAGPAGPSGTYRPTIVFEFDDLPVRTEPTLPAAPASPFPSGPRTPRRLAKRLRELGPPLRVCYRSLRWVAPTLAGQVEVRLTVDPWGGVRGPLVWARIQSAQPLEHCVEQALKTLRFDDVTPRVTELRFVIAFQPSGQRRPSARPPEAPVKRSLNRPKKAARRPAAAASATSRPCIVALAPLPVDRPLLPEPFLRVTDFDPVQACRDEAYEEANKRREKCRSKLGSRAYCRQYVSLSHCRGGYPIRAVVLTRPDARRVRVALMAQTGSYQACYRAAIRRRPGAAGTVAFWLSFPGVGLPLSVRHDGGTLTVPELTACLGRAFAKVQLPRFPGRWQVKIRIPLAFAPGAASSPGGEAREAEGARSAPPGR